MPILLVLIATLAGADPQCGHTNSLSGCDAQSVSVADAAGERLPADEYRHIAEVTPQAGPAPSVEPSEPLPAPEPAADPDPAPEAGDSIAAPVLTGAWVVQVGAFGDRAAARRFADLIDRDSAVIVPTRRDGQDWYVVLLGEYPGFEEAESSARDYAADSGGEYWVRSAAGLQKVLRREDDGAI